MNVFVKFIIVLTVSHSLCASNQTEVVSLANLDDRIIKGKNARLGQLPWQISIRARTDRSNRRLLCGGSLITVAKALTAAYCCYGYDKFDLGIGTVVLDKKNGFSRSTRNCTIHKGYKPKTFQHNIAIVNFDGFFWTPIAKRIDLPFGPEKSYLNANAVTSGWGRQLNRNESSILKYINVRVISNSACQKSLRNVYSETICAKGLGIQSTCDGDTGGPLAVKQNGQWTLIGVISFVSSSGCNKGFPMGYTRVSKYLKWIYKN